MKHFEKIFKHVIEEMVPFNKYLGFKLEEIKEGYARIRVPFKEEFIGDPRNQRIHGGLSATLIDTVGGAAAMTTLTSYEDQIATIDMRVDYLKPAHSEDLIAEGHILRSGNRIVVCEMKVFQPSSQDIIAAGKAVYNVIRKNTKQV
jgi:uncharacterized protein (TIGR00369 family)